MSLRRLASVLMVVPLIASLATNVSAQTAINRALAIAWGKPDTVQRTITVTVKLAYYVRSCLTRVSCVIVSLDDAKKIDAAIMKYWNNGSYVRCYRFLVVVQSTIVASQADVRPDAVDVGLDYSPTPLRVTSAVEGSTDYLGNRPGDRLTVIRDPEAPTQWPAHGLEQTYAHEFGHVLGLHDNYDPANPTVPLPGASDDLMFRKQGEVTNEMVERAARRSGSVDVDALPCDYRLDFAMGWQGGISTGDTSGTLFAVSAAAKGLLLTYTGGGKEQTWAGSAPLVTSARIVRTSGSCRFPLTVGPGARVMATAKEVGTKDKRQLAITLLPVGGSGFVTATMRCPGSTTALQLGGFISVSWLLGPGQKPLGVPISGGPWTYPPTAVVGGTISSDVTVRAP